MNERGILFCDCETTGISERDVIIEIGGILTDFNLNELDRIELKVQFPYTLMTPAAQAKNGFNGDVWDKEARPFSEFMSFLSNHSPYGTFWVPCGHNVGFDLAFIRRIYAERKAFCPLSYHQIDTVGIACMLRSAGVFTPEDLKLETVCKALGLPPSKHRAMADAEACLNIMQKARGLLCA